MKRYMVTVDVGKELGEWLDDLPEYMKKSQHLKLALELYRRLGPDKSMTLVLKLNDLDAERIDELVSRWLVDLSTKELNDGKMQERRG